MRNQSELKASAPFQGPGCFHAHHHRETAEILPTRNFGKNGLAADESIDVESNYNLNNVGFGTLLKLPVQAPEGYAAFGPGFKPDPRNAKVRHSRHADGRGIYIQFPFSPYGLESLTPFVLKGDWPSSPADPKDRDSAQVDKFTHPSAAPDIPGAAAN